MPQELKIMIGANQGGGGTDCSLHLMGFSSSKSPQRAGAFALFLGGIELNKI